MKRFLLIDLLWLALVLLAGWTWSLHDQSAYADRLDHFGVTEDAQRYATKSTQTLADTAQQLKAAEVDHLTVQFQAGDTIFVYSKDDPNTLPLSSGQWFTDADMQTDLPVLVVGSALTGDLYTGSGQRYALESGRYLPVIGVVATRKASPLNRVTFTNASAAGPSAPRLNDVKILVDGRGAQAAKAKLTRIFHVTKVSAYHYQTTAGNSWWADNGKTLLRSVGLLAGLVVITALAMLVALWQTPTTLLAPLRQHYLNGLWLRGVMHVAGTSALGLAASMWWFCFSEPIHLWLCVIGGWALFALGLRLGLTQMQARREQEHGG